MYSNEWIVVGIIFIVLIICYRAGFLIGLKNKSLSSQGHSTRISNIQAGLMGILGVMLAFSFSLSSQRFELKRQLIIQESMKIGTAYFRAGLLPDTLKQDVRGLIREYIDERIHFYQSGNMLEEIEKSQIRSENIQVQIWAATAILGREKPNLNTNINVLALSDVIETSGNITSTFQSRVPIFIHILLTFITACTMLTIGYNNGLSDDQNTPFVFLLSCVLCIILFLIIDLDTPTTGFLKSEIHSLIQLKEEIHRYDK